MDKQRSNPMDTTYDTTNEMWTSGLFWFKVLIVLGGLAAIIQDLIVWAPR